MVTIYDIARECNCSSATVSKVFNNTGNISEKRRKEILATADRLGYVPNFTARSLVSNRSYMVGVLVFVDKSLGLRHELFAEILNAFRLAMEDKKYEIVLISEEVELWRGSLLNHCKALRLDGVFCLTCDYDTQALKELAAGDIPLVGFEIPYPDASCVESKNYEASRELTEYLISLGHQKIAFIAGTDTSITRERIRGYRDAIADAGLAGQEFLLQSTYFSYDEGRLATQLLMESGREFTAVMYPDDFTAIAGLRELKKYGLSVPDDVSICGFYGVSNGRLITPQLTTMAQNARELGTVAAGMLLDKIDGVHSGSQAVRLDTALFKGESTARV